jgi:histidinol phosphatase-like PHP family hydrolase
MIDLHMHTVFSDGVLLPFELARRAEAKGCRAIAITDHVDASNLDFVVPRMVEAAHKLKGQIGVTVLAGAELTHIPPAMIAELMAQARALGAEIVLVHGETLVEPVLPGTNRAGIEAGADILAHPGLITDEEAALAASRGVALEITSRKGHSLSNGHVAAAALKAGAALVINTDSHAPEDLITEADAARVLRGAGLSDAHLTGVFAASASLVEKALRRSNA